MKHQASFFYLVVMWLCLSATAPIYGQKGSQVAFYDLKKNVKQGKNPDGWFVVGRVRFCAKSKDQDSLQKVAIYPTVTHGKKLQLFAKIQGQAGSSYLLPTIFSLQKGEEMVLDILSQDSIFGVPDSLRWESWGEKDGRWGENAQVQTGWITTIGSVTKVHTPSAQHLSTPNDLPVAWWNSATRVLVIFSGSKGGVYSFINTNAQIQHYYYLRPRQTITFKDPFSGEELGGVFDLNLRPIELRINY